MQQSSNLKTQTPSKYLSQMPFPKNTDREEILSIVEPIKYTNNKKISLSTTINDEEKDDIYVFIKDQNVQHSGNVTLLPKSELDRFLRFNAYTVLMKGGQNNSILGFVLSIPLPVKCSFPAGCVGNVTCSAVTDVTCSAVTDVTYTKDKVITHGLTTYLNVNSKLRGHGLAMALIRELTNIGYQNKILCSYQLTAKPLSEKYVNIFSWYRPLNLARSIGLGFSFPNWNEPHNFQKNRMKYQNKPSSSHKEYKIERILEKNKIVALQFYKKINQDKTFVFYPDIELFTKWIQEYPSYYVTYKNNQHDTRTQIVGMFSLNSIFCKMITQLDGVLCMPLFFNSEKEHTIKVLKCLISIAAEREFDVLYLYEVGDLTEDVLNSVNAIKNKNPSYFSLYNNGLNLTSKDIYVPLL